MISQLAYIHPDAKIGKNVTVEPFAYIAADVVLGERHEAAHRADRAQAGLPFHGSGTGGAKEERGGYRSRIVQFHEYVLN